MTSTLAPKNPTAHPRHAQEAPLNPLRYHAMINPARIPEPVSLPRRRFRPAALVGSIVALAVVGAAVLFGPLLWALLRG